MSCFQNLQQHMQTLQLKGYGKEFVVDLDRQIYELMPHGKANIQTVSAAMCVSTSKLRRMIQNYTGITPAHYILFVRMREALRLLSVYPKYSISTIASLCGFSDHSHFTHVFIRFFDCTPLQYVQENVCP